MVLGIGGWRLLHALGIHPEVCHLNEGHAAFAVLERARSFMQETAQPFETALAVTQKGNLFTTHTAVAAGFDRFAPALIEQYLGRYAQEKLGIPVHDLLALGRQNPMTRRRVSTWPIGNPRKRSGQWRESLTRESQPAPLRALFPHWPEDEVPVGHVINGVHMPTWDSKAADDLWTKACGKDRWLHPRKTWSRTFAASPTPALAISHGRQQVAD